MAGAVGGRLLSVCSFGNMPVPYAAALALQEGLTALRHAGEIPDTLLALQHAPVYTLGKRGKGADVLASPEELQQLGAEVHHSPRGGETTYHGPGQVVLYPIVNIRELRVGARAYVEGLEDTMIRTVGEYGVHAQGRLKCRTGVWVGDRKIGAIGVRIAHGIASHGLALNVATDLAWFDHIIACGNRGTGNTSLQQEVSKALAASEESNSEDSNSTAATVQTEVVTSKLVHAFADTFGYTSIEFAEIDDSQLGAGSVET